MHYLTQSGDVVSWHQTLFLPLTENECGPFMQGRMKDNWTITLTTNDTGILQVGTIAVQDVTVAVHDVGFVSRALHVVQYDGHGLVSCREGFALLRDSSRKTVKEKTSENSPKKENLPTKECVDTGEENTSLCCFLCAIKVLSRIVLKKASNQFL